MIDIVLSLIAILISVVSLISTLRKKEYGQFLFIQKEGFTGEIWIKLIKSDIYDIEFLFNDNIRPSRIKVLTLEDVKDSILYFDSSKYANYKSPVFNENSIIKISLNPEVNIKISYKDRFNNQYYQILTSKEITDRKQINKLNLTFGGSQ
jgi:hypothetical protein